MTKGPISRWVEEMLDSGMCVGKMFFSTENSGDQVAQAQPHDAVQHNPSLVPRSHSG